MTTSSYITQNDLTGILNEVLPSPMMIQTVQYTSTITWYSTSNPFGDVYTDIEIDGWTPINLSYLIGGSLSSFVFGSQIELKENNGVMCAHGYFRMTGQTPSSTTQNSVIWTVTYIKNAPMTLPIADYIVEQGTSGIWTYRKWNSGISECWGMTSPTSIAVASWNAWGSVYEGLITTEIDYPVNLFTSYPSLTATAVARSTAGTMGIEISATGNASRTPYFYAIRPNKPGAAVSVSASIHAKGTWK